MRCRDERERKKKIKKREKRKTGVATPEDAAIQSAADTSGRLPLLYTLAFL